MPSFQQKKLQDIQRNTKYDAHTGKSKQKIETTYKSNQMSNVTEKTAKVTQMFKELTESMIKEVKEGMMIMSH